MPIQDITAKPFSPFLAGILFARMVSLNVPTCRRLSYSGQVDRKVKMNFGKLRFLASCLLNCGLAGACPRICWLVTHVSNCSSRQLRILEKKIKEA